MSFVPDELFKNLGSLTKYDADSLDFGVVKVDDTGKVLLFNNYEPELGKEPTEAPIGKNFFTQIAPCTNNKIFRGVFEDGVRNGSLNEEFIYTFTYIIRPTNVSIHLYKSSEDGSNWIFVKKFIYRRMQN